MAKKSKKHKRIAFHFRTYFIAVFACVVAFMATSYILKPQFSCANSLTCKSDLSIQIDNNAIGIFQGRKIIPPPIDLAKENLDPKSVVLGANTAKGDKHIYINLATQTLYAFQGKTQVMKTLISSGKWGRTPTGNFNVWVKIRSTRMAGGSGADAYDVPNVPYVMYFYNDYGLHGAYWHNNFGHPMSHGCVNMRPIDAKELFSWVDAPTKDSKGTPVSVCNSFTLPNTCVQEDPIN